jgi:hypothetical protein
LSSNALALACGSDGTVKTTKTTTLDDTTIKRGRQRFTMQASNSYHDDITCNLNAANFVVYRLFGLKPALK